MSATGLTGAAEQSEARTCWSAVALLRVGRPATLLDGALSRRLDELLSAVGCELEVDPESLPKEVRCAAVELAAYLARRSSSRGPGAVPIAVAPDRARRGSRAGRPARDIPFTPSIRLGRMG